MAGYPKKTTEFLISHSMQADDLQGWWAMWVEVKEAEGEWEEWTKDDSRWIYKVPKLQSSQIPHGNPSSMWTAFIKGFPGGASGKEPICQRRRCKRCRFNPWIGKIPWRRKWQPTPVFLTWKITRREESTCQNTMRAQTHTINKNTK